MSDDETIDIKVTVIGTPRPIVRPSITEAVLGLGEWARAHERIGPSLADAMLALARTGGRF